VTGNVAGFSLRAGVAAKANQRDKLERLCCYITRPAISKKRLSLMNHGKVRYELKTPYRDGTTHVIKKILEHLDKTATPEQKRLPQSRAPPQDRLSNLLPG